ncbi:hypothetical protein [Dethiobacter alkaliphilus]|uniref:hypothetical protein n=1 Tax=Dethiobacter alkaliphilus TaxID=427926 RepID=UPI002227F8A1|nr:hypothetical protein [Dethiobacter alkaliphilus]MCW3490370.1 hypothetical protein [Dethiobacter alkaliphilus]
MWDILLNKALRVAAGACIVLLLIDLWPEISVNSILYSEPLPREQGLYSGLLAFASLNLLHIADIREIILPAKKTNLEKIVIAIFIVFVAGLLYFEGQGLFDYILGALGLTVVILCTFNKGISSRGFNNLFALYQFFGGNWNKIEKVELSTKEDVNIRWNWKENWKQRKHPDNDEVAVLILRKGGPPRNMEILYLEDDVEKVISLLREHLPAEKIKIREQL